MVLREKRNRSHKERLLPRNFYNKDSAQSIPSDAYRNEEVRERGETSNIKLATCTQSRHVHKTKLQVITSYRNSPNDKMMPICTTPPTTTRNFYSYFTLFTLYIVFIIQTYCSFYSLNPNFPPLPLLQVLPFVLSWLARPKPCTKTHLYSGQ